MMRTSRLTAAVLGGVAFCSVVLNVFSADELILNGNFQAQNISFPPYWISLNYTGGAVQYFTKDGPQNQAFVRLQGEGNRLFSKTNRISGITQRGAVHLCQNNLKLVKGETYLLGAWFRTKDLRGKYSGIRVGTGAFPEFLSEGKTGSNAIFGLPDNLSEWTWIEKEIRLQKEEKKNYPFYNILLIVEAEGGTMDVAGVSLKPISQKAKKSSCSQSDNMKPRLVPLSHLWYVSSTDPHVDYLWVGPFADDPSQVECHLISDKQGKIVAVPFSRNRFSVSLDKTWKNGIYPFTVQLVRKSDHKILFEEKSSLRILDMPEEKNTKILNNMVTEFFNGEIADGGSVSLANHYPGWLFVKFLPKSENTAFQVELNGKTCITEATLRKEIFREVEPGKFTFKVKGTTGVLIVRSVPEIMTFALMTPAGGGNGKYDWEFCKKHLLPALTTINCGGIGGATLDELHAMGRQYLANCGVMDWRSENPNDADVMLTRFQRNKNLSSKTIDGVTMDEVEGWYPCSSDPYAEAIRRLPNPNKRKIVTYMTGPLSPSYANVFSSAVNASGGRGWIGFEVYNRVVPTEELCKNYLTALKREWEILHYAFGELARYAGPQFGNFNHYPSASIAHYPAVDFKYFLDMHLWLAANDPSFKDLRKLGFWGTYATDEETARWSFRLLRHYAIEGKKDMLSRQYGYKYISGHLRNTDFCDGWTHWQKCGNVILESFPGFGKDSACFLSAAWEGTGDSFALFTRETSGPSELIQTAKCLKKGSLYCLKFMTADYTKILTAKSVIEKIPLFCTINGGEIISQYHYTGNAPRAGNKLTVRPNYQKIIFRALDENAEIIFSDKEAVVGSKLILNHISLHPYYETEEIK